jgi:hypothetical protein
MDEKIAQTPQAGQLLAALAKAMGEVKRLAKSEKNTEQKYSFASVDDFLAMAGPVCAANGILIDMDEAEVEAFDRQGKYGPSYWVRVTFSITVWHVSGESLPPRRRTVEVIRTGAQSFGSAQSYALKQFLRALLMIPTGDPDVADATPEATGRPVTTAPGDPSQALKDAWVAGVLDALPADATETEKAAAFADQIAKDFAKMKSLAGLEGQWSKREPIIGKLQSKYPDLWGKVVDAFENRKNEIADSASERLPA